MAVIRLLTIDVCVTETIPERSSTDSFAGRGQTFQEIFLIEVFNIVMSMQSSMDESTG